MRFEAFLLLPLWSFLTVIQLQAGTIYEIKIRQAMGNSLKAPVVLTLEEEDGEFTRGMVVAPHVMSEPAYEVDFKGLQLEANELMGTVGASWRTPLNSNHPERPQTNFRTEFQLQIAFEGQEGRGTAKGKHITPQPGRSDRVRELPETQVDATRHESFEYPDEVQFELGIYQAHHEKRFGWMCVRFTTVDGQANKGFAVYKPHKYVGAELPLKASFDGKTLQAEWTYDLPGKPITCKIAGEVLGRSIAFQAKLREGSTSWKCGGHGRVILSKRRLPEHPTQKESWEVPCTLEPDKELIEEAAKVANRPLGVIEPTEKKLLWTWRLLTRFDRRKNAYQVAQIPLSAIHPPAFDLEKVKGAKAYRFTVRNEEGQEQHFESKVPYSSVAPIWPKLEPGQYTLQVAALDKNGEKIGKRMHLRYGADNDVRTGQDIRVLTSPLPESGIQLIKRPAFQGPYYPAQRNGHEAAFKWARYVRENQHLAAHKGLFAFPGFGSLGGDGKQNYRFMDHAMSNLVAHKFTEDPEERTEALRAALHAGESGEHDISISKANLIGTYKFNSNTHNVAGDAFLNMYEFTKDERWKDAALKFARGLAKSQKEDGSWNWVWGDGRIMPKVEKFGKHWYVDCNPSEVLSFYGRLRHELKTEEFLDVEKKAVSFLREWIESEFTWTEVGPHSWCWEYPLKIHSRSPQHFALYLLFHAKEEERDLKLAEELALWSEDRNISWDRTQPAKGQRVGPHGFGSCDGFRSSGPPASFVSRLALIYLKIFQYTENRLHQEKAKALFASVVNCQHSDTGYLNRGQIPTTEADDYPAYKHQLIGHTLRYLIDFETLAQELGVETTK